MWNKCGGAKKGRQGVNETSAETMKEGGIWLEKNEKTWILVLVVEGR